MDRELSRSKSLMLPFEKLCVCKFSLKSQWSIDSKLFDKSYYINISSLSEAFPQLHGRVCETLSSGAQSRNRQSP